MLTDAPKATNRPTSNQRKTEASRRVAMPRTSDKKADSFDRFMRAMAKALGVPRKRLDRIVFQNSAARNSRQREAARHNRPPVPMK